MGETVIVGDIGIVRELVLEAQAKLNLSLGILGKRHDGYHDIESVVQSIDVYDGIFIRTGPPVPVGSGSRETDIMLTCDDTSIPTGRGNLAFDAALALAEFADLAASVEIRLEKGIPISSGLGGGSADAAAVLLGLNHLWQLGLGQKELMVVGERLGADVPFCIIGGTGVIRGKGERVEPLPTRDDLWFVIVTLHGRISAAQAYAVYDQLAGSRVSPHVSPDVSSDVSPDDMMSAPCAALEMIQAIKAGTVRDVACRLTNDLERAAVSIVPSIVEAKQALLTAGSLGVGMSGSGPTVFGIADSRKRAEQIRSALEGARSAPGSVSNNSPINRGLFKGVLVCQAVSDGVTCKC